MRGIAIIALALVCAPRQDGAAGGAPIGPDERQQAVRAVAATVEREYFDVRVGESAAARLRQAATDGRYDDAVTDSALAARLTADLAAETRDKHLAVTVVRPAATETRQSSDDESRATYVRHRNFGVHRVEILAGNVGYLELTSFFRPNEASDAIAAAMRLLRHADALILDLRENGGGSPDTVGLVAGYLLKSPGLPLFEIVSRAGDVQRYAAPTPAPEDADAKRPVFALTSGRTFSGGEGMAFLLQDRHRAEVIGERTAGAANPGRPYPAGTRFEVTVPNGRVRMAVSGRNWEGTGVTPDIPVRADDALRIAHLRALRMLVAQTAAGAWHDTLVREIAKLDVQ